MPKGFGGNQCPAVADAGADDRRRVVSRRRRLHGDQLTGADAQRLKRYGMILADNGSPWYVTGAPDPHWNDDELHDLHQITGADFEVVDTSGLVNP